MYYPIARTQLTNENSGKVVSVNHHFLFFRGQKVNHWLDRGHNWVWTFSVRLSKPNLECPNR